MRPRSRIGQWIQEWGPGLFDIEGLQEEGLGGSPRSVNQRHGKGEERLTSSPGQDSASTAHRAPSALKPSCLWLSWEEARCQEKDLHEQTR